MKMTIPKVLLSVAVAIIIMLVCQIAAGLLGSLPVALGAPMAVGGAVSGIVYTLLGLWLLKIYCAKVLHCELAELRISKVGFKALWVAVAVALPVLVSAVYLLLPGRWAIGELSADNIAAVSMTAVFSTGISAGVVEEAMFRGLIMTALQKRWNTAVAVIVPSVIFALLHVFNAPLDALSFVQLLIAGTTVGVMFSLITLQSGSIWNSALVHAVWNAVIIGRVLNISAAEDISSLVSYVMASRSFLLTGGDFGIEASVVSIGGYVAVIVLAMLLMRKTSAKVTEVKTDNG